VYTVLVVDVSGSTTFSVMGSNLTFVPANTETGALTHVIIRKMSLYLASRLPLHPVTTRTSHRRPTVLILSYKEVTRVMYLRYIAVVCRIFTYIDSYTFYTRCFQPLWPYPTNSTTEFMWQKYNCLYIEKCICIYIYM